jgi:hypothetical protein
MMKSISAFVALCLCACASAAPASAAGKPLALHVSSVRIAEGGIPDVLVSTSGGNGRAVQVTWVALSGTAKAGLDFPAFYSAVVTVDNKHPAHVRVPTIENARVTGDLVFTVKATVSSGSAHPTSSGTVTILDNDVAPPPVVVPPPVVTPPVIPTPPPSRTCPDGSTIPADQACASAPPTGSVITTDLAGVPSIASNFDINLEMIDAPIPASAAPDTLGAFRFICLPGQILPDDSIVWLGQPGKSHLHQFYGNTAANGSSTYESLRTSGDSTCMSPVNRSAYWMPAMLDGKGNVVRPDYVSIYYKRYPASSPQCTQGKVSAKGCVQLPNGLRFIMGRDMLNLAAPSTGNFHFLCDNNTGTFATLGGALAVCKPGNHIIAVIDAPMCWNGKDLDTADHRSHVGYMHDTHLGYPGCDAEHPYIIPEFTMSANYSVVAGDDPTLWSFSSDAMAPNEPHGSTYHADWFGAWDPTVLATWTDNCINKLLNCSGGILGNGKQMKQSYGFTWSATPRLVPLTSVPWSVSH